MISLNPEHLRKIFRIKTARSILCYEYDTELYSEKSVFNIVIIWPYLEQLVVILAALFSIISQLAVVLYKSPRSKKKVE